jgi:hypothetical protein
LTRAGSAVGVAGMSSALRCAVVDEQPVSARVHTPTSALAPRARRRNGVLAHDSRPRVTPMLCQASAVTLLATWLGIGSYRAKLRLNVPVPWLIDRRSVAYRVSSS